jgi:hypothetical protein
MICTVADMIAEALFVSDLQPSENPAGDTVQQAVTEAILRHGADGCAGLVAVEFGDHPETAVPRMGWVRRTMATAFPTISSCRLPSLAG